MKAFDFYVAQHVFRVPLAIITANEQFFVTLASNLLFKSL